MRMSKYKLCICACKYAISEQLRQGSDGYVTSKEDGEQEIDWKEVMEWLNKEQEHAEWIKSM